MATDVADVILRDGRSLRLRPPRREDAAGLLAFFGGLSERSLYRRFHGFPQLGEQLVEPLLETDWQERGALMATLAEEEGESVVAIANYVRLRDPALAEAAFAVADAHQRRGIGTRLLEQLAERAAGVGIESFVAEVLPGNQDMLGVFEAVGFELTRELQGGELEVRFPIASTERYELRVAERDHTAVTASLRPFFEPRTVAVIGASRRRGSIGGELFRNILEGDFAGAAYPVNRDGEPVAGVRAYRSIEDVPETVDVAVISLPGAAVLEAAEQALQGRYACARGDLRRLRGDRQRRCRASGAAARARPLPRSTAHRPQLPRDRRSGAEPQRDVRGSFGAVGEHRLLVAERGARGRDAGGGRVAGPRTLGVRVHRQQGRRVHERPARVVGGRRRDRAGADVRGVVRQPAPVRSPRAPRRTPQAGSGAEERHERERAPGGELHTAALAGSEAAVDALFRHAGVIRAASLEELVDVAALLSTQPEPRGRSVAVLTNAGGLGILCADACEAAGLELATLGEETAKVLADVLPAEASVANPVDMLGGATAATYAAAVPRVLGDTRVDALIVLFAPRSRPLPRRWPSRSGRRPRRGADKPVLAVIMAAEGIPGAAPRCEPPRRLVRVSRNPRPARSAARPSGPNGCVPRRATSWSPTGSIARRRAVSSSARWPRVTTLVDAGRHARASARLRDTARRESASRRARTRRLARRRSSASPSWSRAPCPGAHKTEAGGIALDLRDAAAVLTAAERIGGAVLVQPMIRGGAELLAGVVQDPVFGPLVAFGPGGVFAELIGEAGFRIAPLTDTEAAELVSGGKAGRLVAGFRGAPAADADALADLVLRLARLGDDLPAVAELDLNPVLALPDGCVAVDARVRVTRPEQRPRTKTW